MNAPAPGDGQDQPLLISYLTLRKAVGLIGVTFPFVLAIGNGIMGGEPWIRQSISDYYETDMRNVFVGVLFAIALFMFAYRGFDWRDELAGKLASAFSIGVALFPAPSKVPWVPKVHYVLATALFLTFAYFSTFLFTKTDPNGTPTKQKLARNHVYVASGVAIVAFIALIGVYVEFWTDTWLARFEPVFCLESFALFAFGVSWGVKGETILKDV